jgi:gliding motility-associated protein GldE
MHEIFLPIQGNIVVWVDLLMMVLFVCGSALISSSETAFFSLTLQQLNDLERFGDDIDKAIAALINKPRKLLGTLLIANNIFNLSIVVISYSLFQNIFQDNFSKQFPIIAFLVQVVLVTLFIVIFGEVIPKVLATHHNLKIARFALRPISFFNWIFSPAVKILTATSNFVEKRLEKSNKSVTAKDIDDAIDIAANKNKDEFAKDTKILKSIVKFGNITVTEIMRSRMDVLAANKNMLFTDILAFVQEAGYSRIPVFEGDLDKVIGILYVKDLLPHLDAPSDFAWQTLIKTPFFVPETKKIDDLLEEFQSKRTHMAIVVDEYGGSSGIVTLEDVLEEVIGEIKDEFDDIKEIEYTKIDENNYIFEGKTAINDVCKIMNLPSDAFDAYIGDADSLAGLILEIKGEMPKSGEILDKSLYIFRILEMNTTRIIKIKITKNIKK